MAIYPVGGRQYGAVYGRKRRFPYRAFIEAQIPRLYQSKRRMEEKGIAERGLGLEEERIGLETEALEESRRVSEATLAESIRISGIQAGLEREQMGEAKKQAKRATVISGAQTGVMGTYVGSKLLGKGKVASSIKTTGARLIGGKPYPTGGATKGLGVKATFASRIGPAAAMYAAGEVTGRYIQPRVKEVPREVGSALKGAGVGMMIGGPPGAAIGAALATAQPYFPKELKKIIPKEIPIIGGDK